MSDADLSRRRWLLRLGETVVLSGLSGIDLEGDEATKLPPGLYEPSLTHLTHILKPPSAESSTFTPQFFSTKDFQVIEQMTALLLEEDAANDPVPEISQWIDLLVEQAAAVQQAVRNLPPGQRRLAVDFYGEHAVRELEETDPQLLSKTGLAKLNHVSFLKLSKTEQIDYLKEMEAAHDSFFLWMKARVIEGFYTSREGLKELDYKGNSFYSVSPGCDHPPKA